MSSETEEKLARELPMNHKHCIFCGDEIPNPYPSNWDSVCKSPANTLEPDTVGNRHHAFLAPANLEEEFAKVRQMLKENDIEGLAAYANKNNRERAKKRVRELTEQRERGGGSAKDAEKFDKKVYGYHGEPCDRYLFAEAYASSRLAEVSAQLQAEHKELIKAETDACAFEHEIAQSLGLGEHYEVDELPAKVAALSSCLAEVTRTLEYIGNPNNWSGYRCEHCGRQGLSWSNSDSPQNYINAVLKGSDPIAAKLAERTAENATIRAEVERLTRERTQIIELKNKALDKWKDAMETVAGLKGERDALREQLRKVSCGIEILDKIAKESLQKNCDLHDKEHKLRAALSQAQERLLEVTALIDELRLKATGLADDSGFNVTYDVPAGLLHKFLGWRSGASYSPKATLGTYACPICGRDTPHTAQTHADDEERKKAGFYQQWLDSLTDEERGHFFNCRDGHCERCDGFSNIAVKMRGLDRRVEQLLAEEENASLRRALSQAQQALRDIQLEIEAMDIAGERLTDSAEVITGYKFKTGKWHKLLGMIRGGIVSSALAQAYKANAELARQVVAEAALPSDAPPSSELNLPCLACGKPKNDSTMHHDAPGKNWGAALHWFEAPPSDAPEQSE